MDTNILITYLTVTVILTPLTGKTFLNIQNVNHQEHDLQVKDYASAIQVVGSKAMKHT